MTASALTVLEEPSKGAVHVPAHVVLPEGLITSQREILTGVHVPLESYGKINSPQPTTACISRALSFSGGGKRHIAARQSLYSRFRSPLFERGALPRKRRYSDLRTSSLSASTSCICWFFFHVQSS